MLASCLTGAAVVVIVAGGSARRPVRRLRLLVRPVGPGEPVVRPAGPGEPVRSGTRPAPHPAGAGARTGSTRSVPAAGPHRPRWWPDRIRAAAGLAAVAAFVLVGGASGLFAAVLTGLAADRLLRRVEPRATRDRRLREAADLPLAADLLAAALRAGAPVDRAVLAVAEALGGPLAERLGRAGRTLELGGTAAEAWAHLHPVPGADRLAAAATRSADSGAALAGALTRLADDLRADRSSAAEAAARRAGVLIVLPLGLCFLPAFILAGLVPVIVAVLGDVL
ncbi:type II secretion system F family protein [Micromonospora auratinigra]|uniref:type II secretion system F family protein n=1 Tax=Micromonospora auratinigra TaxID=261654 RepID=UPI001E3F2A67|nr:type II secretion system F family protein [Micromonospora auratinigra]